jgi:hypothetical protein
VRCRAAGASGQQQEHCGDRKDSACVHTLLTPGPGRRFPPPPSATGRDRPQRATVTPTTDTNDPGRRCTQTDSGEHFMPGHRRCWTLWPCRASRGPGVRVPLAPPGQRHNSKSWAPGIGTGTAAKYSNGDCMRCRTRVRTGPLPRRQGLRIPGPEPSLEPLSRKKCLPFRPVPLAPPSVCSVLDRQFHG